MTYTRFFAMIATSTLVMFGLMYLNTYVLSHVFFSETRAWMALVMGAAMAIVMLSFMASMYASRAANIAIFAGAAVVFAVALYLVRSQVTVGDLSYMRAMIPHHSIAIMTSERADISDPRVRKLADEIIAAQQKEISEMRFLIADIRDNGDAAPLPSDPPAEVATVAAALAAPQIATLDAQDLKHDEILRALPHGATCTFRRTQRSDPILAAVTSEAGPARGVMKLSGQLIGLSGPEGGIDALKRGPVMTADGVEMAVRPVDDADPDLADGPREADLVFSLGDGLSVGYRGTWACAA